MVYPNHADKLLWFPAPSPGRGSVAESWSIQILETKDNLVSALDYLRVAYNEMLAGEPVRAADDVLAQVDSILRGSEKLAPFTVVSAIRIHGPMPPLAKRRALLLFPAVKAPDRSG